MKKVRRIHGKPGWQPLGAGGGWYKIKEDIPMARNLFQSIINLIFNAIYKVIGRG